MDDQPPQNPHVINYQERPFGVSRNRWRKMTPEARQQAKDKAQAGAKGKPSDTPNPVNYDERPEGVTKRQWRDMTPVVRQRAQHAAQQRAKKRARQFPENIDYTERPVGVTKRRWGKMTPARRQQVKDAAGRMCKKDPCGNKAEPGEFCDHHQAERNERNARRAARKAQKEAKERARRCIGCYRDKNPFLGDYCKSCWRDERAFQIWKGTEQTNRAWQESWQIANREYRALKATYDADPVTGIAEGLAATHSMHLQRIENAKALANAAFAMLQQQAAEQRSDQPPLL